MTQDQPGSSPVHNVASIDGRPVNLPVPNEGCINALREMLTMAENGEITGIVCARLHGDGLGSYTIAGMTGPYSLLGSLDMAHDTLRKIMAERFE